VTSAGTNAGPTTTGGGLTTGAGGQTSTVGANNTTDASAVTGSTTGGVVMLPPPSLITSGEGAYWTVGEVTPGGTAATFTVTSANAHQEWHGWGGTFNEAGWAALQRLSDADRDKAMKLLFDVNEGIGFDWGRIPIGPSDYAVERYHLSDAPGQFSIDHDQMYLIPYIHAAQAIKGDVKYWASPWTPPLWAKTGTTESGGYDKGNFNTEF